MSRIYSAVIKQTSNHEEKRKDALNPKRWIPLPSFQPTKRRKLSSPISRKVKNYRYSSTGTGPSTVSHTTKSNHHCNCNNLAQSTIPVLLIPFTTLLLVLSYLFVIPTERYIVETDSRSAFFPHHYPAYHVIP